jgi:excisionase family DNA binding protein
VSTPVAVAPGMDQLLTYEQAADRLQVKVWTLRRLVRRRELPVVRIGHRTCRVRPVDIARFTERRAR